MHWHLWLYHSYVSHTPYPNDEYYPGEEPTQECRTDSQNSTQDKVQNMDTIPRNKNTNSSADITEQQKHLQGQKSGIEFPEFTTVNKVLNTYNNNSRSGDSDNKGDYVEGSEVIPTAPITPAVNSNNRKYLEDGVITQPETNAYEQDPHWTTRNKILNSYNNNYGSDNDNDGGYIEGSEVIPLPKEMQESNGNNIRKQNTTMHTPPQKQSTETKQNAANSQEDVYELRGGSKIRSKGGYGDNLYLPLNYEHFESQSQAQSQQQSQTSRSQFQEKTSRYDY